MSYSTRPAGLIAALLLGLPVARDLPGWLASVAGAVQELVTSDNLLPAAGLITLLATLGGVIAYIYHRLCQQEG
jgi:hypothetical protein